MFQRTANRILLLKYKYIVMALAHQILENQALASRIYQQGKIAALYYGLFQVNGTNNTAELNGLLYSFKLAQEVFNQC